MIDDLIAEIASLGWFLNNCYQADATLWRVNLRRPDPANDGDWFTDWAEAPTFAEALELCIVKMAEAEFAETPPVVFAKDRTPTQSSGLLAKLGLGKPKVPFERRI
jgi:hypothetical protein